MEAFATLVAVAAATPALPATMKGANCAILTHSGVGLYEVTLDEPCDETECVAIATPKGAVADCGVFVTHTSDTVKTITTLAAGAVDDTVDFSVAFYRIPAGH
jgi:hypothetical protein